MKASIFFQFFLGILALLTGGWIGLVLAVISIILFFIPLAKKDEIGRREYNKRKNKKTVALVISIIALVVNGAYLVLYYNGIIEKALNLVLI